MKIPSLMCAEKTRKVVQSTAQNQGNKTDEQSGKVAQLWQRDRATHAIVTFRASIYGPLDGEMVIVQLCRWKFSHEETL